MFDSKNFLKTVGRGPGVYLMFDQSRACIYIGKAKDLRKRLSSYFSRQKLHDKTALMLRQIAEIEIRTTFNEAEALLLESNLIKAKRPRYNIIFRDDKSYPYIRITTHQEYPRVSFYRGSLKNKGIFFGPYPSVGAVREVLSNLQKIIPVRHCSDSFFHNRSRPCLQYQIKRCSAPCVELIDKDNYRTEVEQVLLLLNGKSNALGELLTDRMETASAELQYEKAAEYRNRISALRAIQARKIDVLPDDRDIDVIGIAEKLGTIVFYVMFVRNGQNQGGRPYVVKPLLGESTDKVLAAFLSQYYLSSKIPKEIISSSQPARLALIQELLGTLSNRSIRFATSVRGKRKKAVEFANSQANERLEQYLIGKESYQIKFKALSKDLKYKDKPIRMECYDISHTGGEAVVGSQIVFTDNGPDRSAYRRFNIQNCIAGDDFGALKELLFRRFHKIRDGKGIIPDIVVIDGGRAHLKLASKTIEEINMVTKPILLSIAKGFNRKPNLDQTYGLSAGSVRKIELSRESFHLVQEARDEAHRFAITGHRLQRSASRKRSTLEGIEGIGPKRRQSLLKYFGGIKKIEEAGIGELAQAPGISVGIAKRIYDNFHH
ncbi:MAG: excinuclease ABC subunit C [Acidiferrobacteraceae bacterium]|nr:excinuclease ABC subunit C [Acidiferrobacteraceae bacterium]|tara:strand:- start:152 stop:1963 length:1812 start_codon:yes stop_codon:yes gene_type:complete